MRTTTRHSALAAAGLLALAPLAVPAATAAPLEGGAYEWTDSYEFDDCGPVIHVEAAGHGRYQIRDANPSTGGQFFRLADKYWFQEVYSIVGGDTSVTRTANAVFFELPPSEVSDDGLVFTYQTREAGQPFVMRDEAGNVLMRDRGAITLEYRFDSLGDSQPGGIQLQDPVLVRLSGPHPGWYSGCEDLVGWLS